MPVPPFFVFLLPVLEFSGDGNEHSLRDTVDAMAARFNLTDTDRAEQIPSGGPVLYSRVSWARTYLKKAGLLEATGKSLVRITVAGKGVLANPPATMDKEYLRQFPTFLAFVSHQRLGDAGTLLTAPITGPADQSVGSLTPDEAIFSAARELRGLLATELHEQVMRCSSAFFEHLVVDLLRAMGYGGTSPDAGQVTGQSGDGGIDGIITEDKLGLDAVYLQAKRWSGNVGSPVVQAFAGAMQGHKAGKGVIITTSEFTRDAADFVGKIGVRIVLVGGRQLVNLMIDHGVGVRTVATHVVRKVDGDYFQGA